MTHSALLGLFVTRQVGFGVILLLLLCFGYWSFEINSLEKFCHEFAFLKWLLASLMVMVALYWGREQMLSKAWLWSDVASKSRISMMIQESMVLMALIVAVLFSVGLGLFFGSFDSEAPLLVPQDRFVDVETRDERWMSSSAADEILGLKVSFWEKGQMSDLTFKRVETVNGSEVTLKANREVFLPQGAALDLPQTFFVGGRSVELRVDKLSSYKKNGHVWVSLGVWFLRIMLDLAFLALALIWIGKHISLEIGLLAVLSSWFVLISKSFLHQGYSGAMLSPASSHQQRSNYTERWWEDLLLVWSRLGQELSSQWFSFGSEGGDMMRLTKGVALKLGPNDAWLALSLLFFILAVCFLDHCALRCR